MDQKKVFFSYTLKGNDINLSFLKKIKLWMETQHINAYIDLLDNQFNEDNFQKKLLEELRTSDIFVIINTSHYKDSNWTNIELKEATALRIKIIDIDQKKLETIINNETFDYLLEHYMKCLLPV